MTEGFILKGEDECHICGANAHEITTLQDAHRRWACPKCGNEWLGSLVPVPDPERKR